MKTNEVEQKQRIKYSLSEKLLFVFVLFLFVLTSSLLLGSGWLYYSLTQTDDLPKYLSNKLSRPNKYRIKIESIKNTLPIVTANNITYNSLNKVSSLSFNINELTIYPDYLNFATGTHSFQISSGTLHFRRSKLLINSNNIEAFGKYCNKTTYIASSSWDLFGGKARISGQIDSNVKPAEYDLYAELYHVRLQNILANSKNKGSFTGEIFGSIKLNNKTKDRSSPFGTATLSIYDGTYYKPELAEKINNALHKIGMQSKLKDLGETVASSSFILKGDFLIDGKIYVTENAVIRTPWCRIKFSGIIGPKSAINGTFVINFKHYSSFNIKVYGPDSKNLNYKISDKDKAQLASIVFREASKGTEQQIKNEGHRTNRRFNRGLDRIGREAKKLWKKL